MINIQQIRNATLKIKYQNIIFLIDPWLQDKGTGFSAKTVNPKMKDVKSPLNDLPLLPEEILQDVDFCLVTHVHPDHFTSDYLPKEIPIITANENDKNKITELGFKNVQVIDDQKLKDQFIDFKVQKTPAVHGDNEEMGQVSGFLFTGGKKSIYIAGDTVFNKEIEEFLKKNEPDIIILNCCAATMPKGRLIMNLEDVKKVCHLCPNSLVILTHFDSVNHALISSKDAIQFIKKEKLDNARVLKNGEILQID